LQGISDFITTAGPPKVLTAEYFEKKQASPPISNYIVTAGPPKVLTAEYFAAQSKGDPLAPFIFMGNFP